MRRVHRRHRPAAFGSGRASCSVTCGSRSSSRDPVPAGAAPRRSPRSVSRREMAREPWVIPVFILDTAASKLADADTTRARDEASSRAPASATRSCATPPKTTASAAPPSAPDTPKPRLATSARPRHPSRARRPHRRPAPRAARDRLPLALPARPGVIAYGAGWTDPRPPAARRRHRLPRTPPRGRSRSSPRQSGHLRGSAHRDSSSSGR